MNLRGSAVEELRTAKAILLRSVFLVWDLILGVEKEAAFEFFYVFLVVLNLSFFFFAVKSHVGFN